VPHARAPSPGRRPSSGPPQGSGIRRGRSATGRSSGRASSPRAGASRPHPNGCCAAPARGRASPFVPC